MTLPYRVESLDAVPEAARGLYEEVEGGFQLPVEGVESADKVKGLNSTLGKLKKEHKELKERLDALADVDADEYRALKEKIKKNEEEAANKEGKLDEIRAAWKKETDTKLAEKDAEISARDGEIRVLVVDLELRKEIVAAGFKAEFHDDVFRAILAEFKPEVRVVNGKKVGVFPDDVHGDQSIPEFVKAYSKTDAAAKYMPPPKGGGGGTGERAKGPAPDKKYKDMTPEEKAVYHEERFKAGAYA